MAKRKGKSNRKQKRARAERNRAIRGRREQNAKSRSSRSSKKSSKLMLDVLGITNTQKTYGSMAKRGGRKASKRASRTLYSRRSDNNGNDRHEALSRTDAVRYGSNSKKWDKIAKKLGLSKKASKRSDRDIARMMQYVTSGGSPRGGGRSRGGNNRSSDSKYDRNSGEFKDIKGALGEDERAGRDVANTLENRGVTSGNSNDAVLDKLNDLLANGLTGGDDQPVSVGGWPSAFDDLMLEQQNRYDTQLATAQQGFDDKLLGLEAGFGEQLGRQQEAFDLQVFGLQQQAQRQREDLQSANSFMQQQVGAANAAAAAAEQRAYNMRNAFVPQANPTALSVNYGDQRMTSRKKENNQLSDLTILSGLGTTSNPLAGLQLA